MPPAPSAAGMHQSTKQLVGMARWWARTRDMPEVLLLYGWLGFALSLGVYSAKEVYFNSAAGSYVNVNLRGDPMKQAETATVGVTDPRGGGEGGREGGAAHSVFWHVARLRMDGQGANIAVPPFDNRARPFQYSKPGAGGVGGTA